MTRPNLLEGSGSETEGEGTAELLFYDGSYTVLFHDDAIATLTYTSLTVWPDGKVAC